MDAVVPAAEERLIGVAEIAQRLDMSIPQVLRMAREGRFPRGIRVGKYKRWRASEVNAWILAQIDRE